MSQSNKSLIPAKHIDFVCWDLKAKIKIKAKFDRKMYTNDELMF